MWRAIAWLYDLFNWFAELDGDEQFALSFVVVVLLTAEALFVGFGGFWNGTGLLAVILALIAAGCYLFCKFVDLCIWISGVWPKIGGYIQSKVDQCK